MDLEMWLSDGEVAPQQGIRVWEYPESERTHRDHPSPAPGPAWTPQQPHPVPQSVVQTLLELWTSQNLLRAKDNPDYGNYEMLAILSAFQS
ncbi:hypothetical protein DUI87_04745 [Hirundo rustica rustica]|uniref:Uncharacterized protein n=1 Tax=Hirundo rustica rustica TaxID=333673 RepID=A0A3M0L036_HIRRU|nr:hypothetical protein DUI87_04745 [Hirundo rustica rustica]